MLPTTQRFNLGDLHAMAVLLTTAMAAVVIFTPSAVQGRERKITPDGITCPPESDNGKGPALEEIYYYSDVVIIGNVTKRHPQPGSGDGRMYTVEMDVYCIYKGDPVPARINITDAGVVPDLCFSTDFNVGQSYVAWLKRHSDGRLSPAYKQHPESYKDELFYICGVSVSWPAGYQSYQCANDYDYDEGDEDNPPNATCFSFDPQKDDTYKHTQDANDQTARNNQNRGREVRKGQVLTHDSNAAISDAGDDADDDEEDDDENSSGSLRWSLSSLVLSAAFIVWFS